MTRLRGIVLVLALLAASSLWAGQGPDVEPPVANRVEPFSGAVGRKFSVTMHADRTELQVGDTLQLTVRVVAEGPWQSPPRRPDLRRHEKYARFPRLFHIENAGERHADDQTWEFVYRLRPRDESVTEIPRLPFVYYKPGQGYQTISAPSLKLAVQARAEVSPAQVQGAADPAAAPERLYHLVEGATVLRHDEASLLPSPLWLILALLVPPTACACWYGAWRWLYPEAARFARLRRSRAAQAAFRALQRLGKSGPDESARQVAETLVEYLRQRFGLSGAGPTPADVAEHLKRTGVEGARATEVTRFLRECDAVRFSGRSAEELADLPGEAVRLILALEAAPCLP